MKGNSGFSLIELSVAITITALLLTIGLPSFKRYTDDTRLTSATNDLLAAIFATRSEAIMRGTRVTLCTSRDGISCAETGGYDQGWIVFSDPNHNAYVDEGEHLIRHSAGSSTITIRGNSTVANYISYTASGRSALTSGAFQAGTITLCAPPSGRLVVISNGGRPRTVRTACPEDE